MPSLFGIIEKSHFSESFTQLERMRQRMIHETSYISGKFSNEHLLLNAGWTCLPHSFSDCMPIFNEKKSIVMIFTGENFADQELFDRLKSKNHRFDSTNASYLVHMYEEQGVEFLKKLNGCFSGVIVDSGTNKIILFNDRFGMQRIYYYEGKDAFYFSSEAKALLSILPELRTLDIKGLGEFLACGCVLENRTLYRHINLLPPASAWTFTNGNTIEKKRYFHPSEWENQTWLEKEFFYDKLKETFSRILPRYFHRNRPIGFSLTGGLDTRMLLANTELAEQKYPCYTFAGMYRDCYDVKIARKIASVINQPHHTIVVDDTFLNDFPAYAEKTIYITDGYLDVTGASEVYVNKIASELAPIRMTGNFGSEVLRDIQWLKAMPANQKSFTADFIEHINLASSTLFDIRNTFTHPLSFTLFADTPWLSNIRLISEQSQLTVRTPFLDNDLVSLMYRSLPDVRKNKELSLRLISDGNRTLASIPTDRGVGGSLIFPLSSLRHIYSEFLFKAEYAYNYGMPQWLAQIDYIFKFMHFEKMFLGRHKFNHYRLWYRDELADYVKTILLDERTLKRPYLDAQKVEHVVHSHTKGCRNYTTEISQLITLELIQRKLIEA